jgi:hypothetical protein
LKRLSLGLLAVGLSATEAAEGLRFSGITLINDRRVLAEAVSTLPADRDLAAAARDQAWDVRPRYGIARLPHDWRRLMKEAVG